jgi:hypothetical protein
MNDSLTGLGCPPGPLFCRDAASSGERRSESKSERAFNVESLTLWEQTGIPLRSAVRATLRGRIPDVQDAQEPFLAAVAAVGLAVGTSGAAKAQWGWHHPVMSGR